MIIDGIMELMNVKYQDMKDMKEMNDIIQTR